MNSTKNTSLIDKNNSQVVLIVFFSLQRMRMYWFICDIGDEVVGCIETWYGYTFFNIEFHAG